jgi:hypothetical protein
VVLVRFALRSVAPIYPPCHASDLAGHYALSDGMSPGACDAAGSGLDHDVRAQERCDVCAFLPLTN